MCICSLYYNIVTLTPKIYVSTIFTIFIYLCKINYIDILKLQRNYTHHILILRKTLCIHGTSLNSQIGIEIIRGIGTTPVLEYPNFTGCTPYILGKCFFHTLCEIVTFTPPLKTNILFPVYYSNLHYSYNQTLIFLIFSETFFLLPNVLLCFLLLNFLLLLSSICPHEAMDLSPPKVFPLLKFEV